MALFSPAFSSSANDARGLTSGYEVAGSAVRVETFEYTAHNGKRRLAYVALPAWYGADDHPAIPLVIAPHGRAATAESMLGRFGELPASGAFAVISPEGQGRRTRKYSWGYARQVDDLARMPLLAAEALPWLEVDAERIYAFGTSMGGQEALLLAARHPRLLAGVAAFDSTVDFALQYANFGRIPCDAKCRNDWHGRLADVLRRLAKKEVGGTPTTAPRAYAARSPITFARRLAFARVPLQLWWSSNDRVVLARRQSVALFRQLAQLNPRVPVEGFAGRWTHAQSMRFNAGLTTALVRFGLLPPQLERPLPHMRSVKPRSRPVR